MRGSGVREPSLVFRASSMSDERCVRYAPLIAITHVRASTHIAT
jgi:hypothetical protein